MVPSSFMISQMTPAGTIPAMRAKIHRGFGLPGANQHSAFARTQRKDVAGTREIVGPGCGIDCDLNGVRAIVGRDAGRVTPSFASTDSVKAVPKLEVFSADIWPRRR